MSKVIDICKQYGINVKKIGVNTYQNIDVDTPVNIDELKGAINNCYLLVSDDVDEMKVGYYWETIAKVYYILTDLKDRDGLQAYYNKAEEKYGEVLVSCCYSSTEREGMISLYQEG